MTLTVSFPLANYPNGTQTSQPTDVNDAATDVAFTIDRCTTATPTIWPNASTGLSLSIEQSNDNGATWVLVMGFTSIGGILVDKHGVELPRSRAATNLNAGTGRKLRAIATVTGGPLRSSGSFDVT